MYGLFAPGAVVYSHAGPPAGPGLRYYPRSVEQPLPKIFESEAIAAHLEVCVCYSSFRELQDRSSGVLPTKFLRGHVLARGMQRCMRTPTPAICDHEFERRGDRRTGLRPLRASFPLRRRKRAQHLWRSHLTRRCSPLFCRRASGVGMICPRSSTLWLRPSVLILMVTSVEHPWSRMLFAPLTCEAGYCLSAAKSAGVFVARHRAAVSVFFLLAHDATAAARQLVHRSLEGSSACVGR